MKLLNNKLFAKIEKRNRKCLLQIRKNWVQNLTNKQTPEGRSKTAKVLNSKRNRFSDFQRGKEHYKIELHFYYDQKAERKKNNCLIVTLKNKFQTQTLEIF